MIKIMDDQEFLNLLKCPKCNGNLVKEGENRIRCVDCNERYVNEEGIIKLSAKTYVSTDCYNVNKECYDKIALKFENFWERIEDWQLEERKKFLRYLNEDPTILDLGCGQGRDLMTLAELGDGKCIGLDFSLSQLKLAKERDVARLVNSDLLNIPFKDNSFDGVWSCVTLLHIKKEDLHCVLKSIKEILKPGGILFISLQEGKGEKIVKREIYNKTPMVIVYYMPDEIKAILEKEGFEILDYERYHVWKGIADKERIFFNLYTRSCKMGCD